MPAGRPLKFENKEILDAVIEAYFDEMDKQKRPYTMSGLALHLGVTRELLVRYSKDDKFHDSIAHAKQRCEAYAEEGLFKQSGQVNGIIFNLKNNYKDWKDEHTQRQVIESVSDEVKDRKKKALEALKNGEKKEPET